MTLKITADNIDLGTLTSVTGPKITLVDYPGDDLATPPAGGATVAITGTGFVNGCQVLVDSVYAPTVTFSSSTSISFTTPAMSAGTYPVYIINPDGGTAIAIPGVSYSGVPAFATNSGSLGTVYEGAAFGSTIAATSDSAVTYSIDSGALPTGFSLNANTGAITGNVGTISNSTTYNFTVKATDTELQDTTRNFSITTSPDAVTFNTPAGNQSYSNSTSDSFSLTLNATSALGRTISYTANALPSGLTLTGNIIAGTFSSAASVASLITATAATSLKTATRLLSWTITSPTLAVNYLVVGGGGGGSDTAGGGGGAGGYRTSVGTSGSTDTFNGGGSSAETALTLNRGTAYTVTIGAGGTRFVDATSDSVFATVTSLGGGGGDWSAGGSGGGTSGFGASAYGYNTRGQGNPGTSGQGCRGGAGMYGSGFTPGGGGGGGGASLAGLNGYYWTGGSGGDGISSSISGTATYYAGGGGGGASSYGGNGQGGQGGGGAGAVNSPGANGTAGTANTGGGGGGGHGRDTDYAGGGYGANGGSGIVILRIPDSESAAASTTGSPTITTAGGYRVYKFTSSGSITF